MNSGHRLIFTLVLGTAAVSACNSGTATSAADAGVRFDGGLSPRDVGASADGGETLADAAPIDAAATDAALGDAALGDAAGNDAALGDASTAVRLPPINAGLDYQLGGAYPLPAGVTIVSRDRTAAPAAGSYNICYINGFQIQPDEVADWTNNHPGLMLRDGAGELVIDADWNEILIDVRTPAQRAAVAQIVGGWIRTCKTSGFDAIEIDNLDSYSRSRGLLTEDQLVMTMRLFSDIAHAEGLAIAQKNSSELVPRRAELGTDFVVAEECNRYSECDTYTASYGQHVLAIEYRRADFDVGCAAFPNLSIVLRDRNLVTPDQGAYVFRGC